jgi:hypothetical protein
MFRLIASEIPSAISALFGMLMLGSGNEMLASNTGSSKTALGISSFKRMAISLLAIAGFFFVALMLPSAQL